MQQTLPAIKHILLADDDIDDSYLFCEAISEISNVIEFSYVSDGEKLLHFLHTQRHPDLIFLDLNMPGKNGKECLYEIRGNEKFDRIPIVIYSTSSGQRDVQACFDGGANYYLGPTFPLLFNYGCVALLYF
jgi:CheY-like chemotaxis protein